MSDATELEAELRQQLQEQIDTLASINAALQEGFDEELSAVKQQLEEAIPALQQSLAEVQQHLNEEHTHEAQQEQQLPQPAIVEPPSWLQSGAFCRFRFTDGRWYHGVLHAWNPHNPMPAIVHFKYPTRAYMLHAVHLPLGLLLPASTYIPSAAISEPSQQSSSQQISVGSRVLALPPGQQLWQPAEVTSISKAAAAGGSTQPNSSACCTVTIVDSGQSMILPLSSVTVSSTADVSFEDPDAAPATADSSVFATAAEDATCPNNRNSTMGESDSGDDISDVIDSSLDTGNDEGSSAQDSEDADDADDREQAAGLAKVEPGSVLHHARLAAEAGVQQETATFADWEDHSRGIASRLMAKMGFGAGQGLGRTGKGMSSALVVTILPSKKGLGAVSKHKHHKARGTTNSKKNPKRNRGGERTRRRKAAAARHAAKAAQGDRQQQMEAATGSEGIFAFINVNLGAASQAADRLRDAGLYGVEEVPGRQTAGAAALASAAAAAGSTGNSSGNKTHQQQQRAGKQKVPDRVNLISSQDDVAAAKARVTQLSAMLERNKSNKGLAPQIEAKLTAARRQLDAIVAQHRRMNKAVAGKEATEKWMKF